MTPYIYLAIALAWGASCWYSYESGGTNKENAIKAQYAKQLDETIKQHNEDSAIDMQAAAEWGAKRAAAAKRGNAQAGKIEADVAKNPLNCRLAEPSVRVLNDSVKTANDLTIGADRLPDAVPGAAGTGERGRGNAPPVGGLGLRPSGGMPAPAR